MLGWGEVPIGFSNVLFITTYSCMVYQCNASEDHSNPSEDFRISLEYNKRLREVSWGGVNGLKLKRSSKTNTNVKDVTFLLNTFFLSL